MTARFDLPHAFTVKQNQLKAALGAVATVSHPTDKGDISEGKWRELLAGLLPQRYQITKATVVDCFGGRSDAIDLVVHDRHFSPLVFTEGSVTYIPAESVYAVFECKSTLHKDHLEYAANKASSVRGLHRTSAPIVHAGGRIDKPKDPPPILAGLLATTGEWTPPFGDPFHAHLPESADGRLDLGCVVDAGAWELPLDGRRVRTVAAESSLVFFALRFLARLQAMGTIPAMDYDAWSAPLWES